MSGELDKKQPSKPGFLIRFRGLFVWMCRLAVGLTFIVSGMSKMIDIWGFIYKIDQYLNVWGCPQPQSLVFTAAAALSGIEFVLGFLMALGCYRKLVTWVMTLIMLFFTPLTLYIVLVNPVPDCGCFGDFIVMSNTATFLKNVLILILLVYLLRNNAKVEGLLTRYSQWLVGWMCAFFMIAVGMIGYTIQPLIDFRPYKVGTLLVDGDSDTDPEVAFRFIYEKDGERRSFSADSLPDESWSFVDREIASGSLVTESSGADLTIYDSDGDDVTAEAITGEGEELILMIPEMTEIDVSSTYVINEMARYMSDRGGAFIGILGTDSDGIELWRDLSMASYPLYTAEDTSIKEVARGSASFVFLRDGVIQWKRTLSSVDTDLLDSSVEEQDVLESLYFPGERYFLMLSGLFLGLVAIVFALDRSGRAVKLHFSRKNQKK
ncbi:MAG: DoxX family protein [Muribaculum sp.]|nr:DoxX family protein [Muribaculum sp.]